MRTPLTALAVALVLTVAGPAMASDSAKQAKPKPDLKITQVEVTGTTSLSVTLELKNAGTKKAGSSTVSLAVSKDATASSDDAVVGTVKAPRVKPRKKAEVTTTVQVPASTVGTYYLIACADSTGKLKERKEGNNCRASVAITVPTVTVTVGGTATAGGSVTAATTAGVCTGNTCTVPSGAATVTLTPVAAAGNIFVGWSGASCSGTTDAQKRRVITNATTAVACTATFAVSRAVSYTTGGAPASAVTATTTAGSCAVTGASAGSCTVPSGAATVTLTAGAAPSGYAFNGWFGDPACTTTTATVTITNPTANVTCNAAYLPV